METALILYTQDEVTEASRLLIEMRENCYFKKDGQTYDDPDRMKKYKALNIALDAIGRMEVLHTCPPKSYD